MKQFPIIRLIFIAACTKKTESHKTNKTTQSKLNDVSWISRKAVDITKNINRDVSDYEEFMCHFSFKPKADENNFLKIGTFYIDSNWVQVSRGTMKLIGEDTIELYNTSYRDTSYFFIQLLTIDSLIGILKYKNKFHTGKQFRSVKLYCNQYN